MKFVKIPFQKHLHQRKYHLVLISMCFHWFWRNGKAIKFSCVFCGIALCFPKINSAFSIQNADWCCFTFWQE